MSAIICDLAAKYQDTAFICTYTFACDLPNVYFTDLIQERIGSDLNEISYLSTYCDAIVGRNSGPFLFTNTKENLASKTFLAFSRDHRECFPYECETKDFRYIRDRSDTVMVDALVQLIEDFK
jgi:hypothetical protein